MRTLLGSSIPNIDSTDLANYPAARFKNKSTPTATDGTELSERTLGDLYQAAVELLRRASITASEVAEKKTVSDIADAILGKYSVVEYTIAGSGDEDITFNYSRYIEPKSVGGIARAVTITAITGGVTGSLCTFICAEADSGIQIEATNTDFVFAVDGITDLGVVTGGQITVIKRADGKWQVLDYLDGNIPV